MAYYGDLFIFGALLTACGSMLFYFLAWRGKEQFHSLAQNFFRVTTGLVSLAIATLLYLILTHDFSVAYVFSYSSTDLPLGYLIASLWGGQEGTFLLWLFFTAIMALVMMRTAGKFEVGNMFFVNLFVICLLVILIKKSPFEPLPVFRTEGAGLNPLLQNFWMQIHPPLMFVGFSAALFPFVFGMTALVERNYETWAESARKWTMFAWVLLGTSLVMGGYWAYVTLGWGGFWAWDPVENSSFIPWIFLAAQVHVLFIKRNRRGLMRFSLFIVALTFWSVLYGTFLTRSGVLADFSVHSFVDLGLNNFLIGGLFLFILIGLTLLIYRWRDINPDKPFSNIFSRSYMLTLGILALFIGGALTLIGTSAPLLTRVTDNPSAVGLDYYFVTMTPIAIVIMTLMGLFPAFRWNNGVAKPKLLITGFVTFVVTSLTLLAIGFTSEIIYLFFFGAAAMAIVVNSYVIITDIINKNFQPGYLSHVGLALAMVGAAVSAGFEVKKTLKLPMNETVTYHDYDLRFTHMSDHNKGFDAMVDINNRRSNDHFVAALPHEFPKNQEGVMRKPHVAKYLTYDLYIAPVSMEQAANTDNNQFTFEKGETKKIDKYEITFHDFTLSSHDAQGKTTAEAELTVAYDGKSEAVAPSISVDGEDVDITPALFDEEHGSVMIAGVASETGGVVLKVMGMFMPPPTQSSATLMIELSEKPLINLFWLGTIICFASGAWSIRNRRRRLKNESTRIDRIGDDTVEPVKKEIAL